MNIADLVSLLGDVASELSVPPPSQSKVESWITKELIAGSQAIGKGRNTPPSWEVPLSSVSAARLILELESKGARRSNELRVGLWLAGHFVPDGALREALSAESNRIVLRMLRKGIPQAVQSSEFREGKRTASVLNKLGPLDARFSAAGLEQTDRFYFEASKIAVLGNRDEADEGKLLLAALHNVAPSLGQLLPELAIGNLFAGLLGSCEEVDSSNAQVIHDATVQQLEDARRLYGIVLFFVENGSLSFVFEAERNEAYAAWLAMRNAMRHPAWMTLMFLVFLRLILEVKFDAAKAGSRFLDPELARSFSDLERLGRSLQILAK